ncbi:unnamed protein product [Camellia sinensis]
MEMVGIFVSPLLKAVINKLLSSVLINLPRQGGVDTSIKKLKKSFEGINDVLADAEDRQISERAVNKWLKELQHLAYDADDVLDEFATEALRKKLTMAETDADVDVGEASTSRKVRRFLLPTCCTGFTPRAISFNFAIGSKIKKINDQLQEVTTSIERLGLVKKAIGGTNNPTNAWSRQKTTYFLDDPFVCGRDEDKKRIVVLLLRDTPTQNKVDVIPITGMGGLGKTTLAQLIYDYDGVKNHFNLKAWVCVSDEFDVKTITKAILESFTLQSCDLTELTALQSKLAVMLAGKKFLLVLDDVWNHRDEEWRSLQSPLRAGAHGSKIIVTMRIAAVAEKVMTIKYHNLPSLSPDVCWLIFSRHAFKNINISEHPELESIGRQIVAKCGGLPLAARALGGLLQCKQNEHEWKMVLSSRKVQLLLGYFVCSISRASDFKKNVGVVHIAEAHDSERLILELEPAKKGLQNQTLEADLVLWTVGSKPLLPLLESCDKPHELPLNARGQAETDDTLRVKGHPRIFSIGDASSLRDSNGRLLPATAQVAFQQADFTGWNLWAAINDRPLMPFRFQNLGEMMTLGRNDAAISPSFLEGLTLEGPIGHTEENSILGEIAYRRAPFESGDQLVCEVCCGFSYNAAEYYCQSCFRSIILCLIAMEKPISLTPEHIRDEKVKVVAVVPKDYEFEEDELVLLWMAEGLIEHLEGGEQIEDVGRKYFHELVSRSFFQLSRHDKLLFIMHDLINDLAQAVAGDICFRLENNLKGGKHNKISDKARHSSYVASEFEGIRKFKAFDDARCLRTFLESLPSRFFNYKTRYLIHDLLPVLKCLRELRLCCSGIDELPDSIGDLKHLRYLDLSHSRIRKLPESVVTLYNLQVLFLKFCVKLKKLPLNMGRLVNLRHFDMTGVHIPSSEKMSLHIGKLTNLQTLSNFMVGKDCGRKIGELKNLSHVQGAIHISRMENVNGVKDAVDANLMSKEDLKELSLEWDESHSSHNDIVERDVLDVMKPFKLLERLTISGYGSTKFPNWVGDVSFSKMTFMQLKGSKCCTSLPPLGQLPLLKDLYIEGMSAIKQLGYEFYGKQHSAKPFPFLETLSFVDMPEWKDWSTFEIEGIQPFGHLSELSIKNCPKLVGRLPNDLPCLNSLEIDGCPQLLIDVSSLVQPSLASLSMNNVMLPSLPALIGSKNTIELGSLNLDISHVTVPDSLCDPCTTDEELLANEMSKHLTSITALSISHVEKLAFLPTWFTQDLMGLEKLDISNCQELITLWRNKERIQYLTIKYCGMLKQLPQDLHTYTSLGVLRINGCESLISFPMKGLPSMLRELGVSECDALESLPELMTLNNLQVLSIDRCASLTYLTSRGGLPSALKQLLIEYCENLESLFAEEGIKIDCPSLENIEIKGCRSLKSLFEANNLKNLSQLQIYDCSNLEPLSLGGHDENNNINQLTSLQKLGLMNCRAGMVSYFVKEGSFPTDITSLSIGNLRVDDVGQLPVPPPSPLEWGLHKLSSLTRLELHGPLLGDWPWGDTVSFPEEGMFLPTSLINLTIKDFPNLERLSYEEFQKLASLQRLHIMFCSRLASLPKEGLPPSLLHLRIWDCPELVTFPEQGFPPSLLSLEIWGCNPILKQKCEKGKEYWPIIQYIPQVDFRV